MRKFTIKSNKKIGKKGFAMAELLAVCVIVLGIFTILFSNFLPLVAEYENRISYNNVTAQYAVHYARVAYRESFKTAANDTYVKNGIASNGYYVLYKDGVLNHTSLLSSDEQNKIKKLMEEYQIKEMIISTYTTTTLKSKYTASSGELYKYIKYLPTYKNTSFEDEPYRIILKSEKFGYATTGVKYEAYEPPQPNHPVLAGNMVAVRHYDSGCTIAENTNGCWKTVSSAEENAASWYNYDAGEWANSAIIKNDEFSKYDEKTTGTGIEIDMGDVLTMQVWIPRFKYTVWNYNSGGVTDSNSYNSKRQIEIEFEDDVENSGQISCSDTINVDGVSESCKVVRTGTTCDNSLCHAKTYTHPAFTFGSNELTGFWIGKFELTGSASEITVKPGVAPLTNLSIGNYDNIIRNLNTNDLYGFSSSDNVHLIKNMEWGAVGYLTYSKYGVCKDGVCGRVENNSSSTRLTGYGPHQLGTGVYASHSNHYETDMGVLASTTGNIYGVYDMSGGTDEYVMGNMVSEDASVMMSGHYSSDYSGFTGILYDINHSNGATPETGLYEGTYGDYPDKKYYDVYTYGTNLKDINRSKLGDGIREIADMTSWHSAKSEFVYAGTFTDGSGETVFVGLSWLTRGGGRKANVNASDYGLFNSVADSGGKRVIYTTRIAISK